MHRHLQAGMAGTGLPDLGDGKWGDVRPPTLWWRHEQLHRGVFEDYPTRMSTYRDARDRLEREFLIQAANLVVANRNAPPEMRAAHRWRISPRSDFARADAATPALDGSRVGDKGEEQPPFFYRQAWKGFNRKAGDRRRET